LYPSSTFKRKTPTDNLYSIHWNFAISLNQPSKEVFAESPMLSIADSIQTFF
jgi:hypothetical protein